MVSTNGSASDRIPALARCMLRAIIRRSVVSRERWSTAGGNYHVAMRQPRHDFAKLRPAGGRAGDLLAEHLHAPRRLRLGDLAGVVLGTGGNASVAVNHCQPSASEKCIKKAQSRQGPRFDTSILNFSITHKANGDDQRWLGRMTALNKATRSTTAEKRPATTGHQQDDAYRHVFRNTRSQLSNAIFRSAASPTPRVRNPSISAGKQLASCTGRGIIAPSKSEPSAT